MNRRGFLSAILAAGVAPAVVRAASLMPVRTLPSGIVTLEEAVSGFGLAQIKEEGSILLYDNPLALWPGIKAFYARCYEQYPQFSEWSP